MTYQRSPKIQLQYGLSLLGVMGLVGPAIAQEAPEPDLTPAAPALSDWMEADAASQSADDLKRISDPRLFTADPLPTATADSATPAATAWGFGATDLPEFRVSRPEPTPSNAPTVPVSSPFSEVMGAGSPGSLRSSDPLQDFGRRSRSEIAQESLVEVDPVIPAPVIDPQQRERISPRIDIVPVGDPRATADARSTVTLQGTVTDASGQLIQKDVVVTLTATAGEFVGTDWDVERPGYQVVARQGRFVAQLRSTLEAQQVRIRAAVIRNEVIDDEDADIDEGLSEFTEVGDPLREIDAFTQVEFVTNLRPSLVTGTINLRIGEAGTDYWGSFRDFLNPDEIDDGVAVDLSAAVFGIGRIGDWLFTGAYNSERALNETCDGEDRLYRDIQYCEQTYPVYGDSSTVDFLTPSQDSLYLRFQRDSLMPGAEPDYFMWGDYATTEFSRESQLFTATDRQLHGFKANYSFGNLQLTAMFANNIDGFQRDAIAPDGTSGYYFLSRRILVPGSENVYLELFDLSRPGTVVDRLQLQRGVDYEIDYDRGAILFRRPILRTEFDPFGNTLVRRIVATYQFEGESEGVTDLIAGRVQYNFSQGLNERDSWLALSYLNEDQGMQDFELFGADFLVPLGDAGRIIGEYAHSNHRSIFLGDLSGDAYRLEASASVTSAIDFRAYYRSADEDFSNNATFSFVPGQTRYGGAIAASLSSATQLQFQYDHEENFGTAPLVRTDLFDLLTPGLEAPPGDRVNNTLTTVSAGVQQAFGEAVLNVNYVNRSREDRTEESQFDRDTSQIVSRLTVPLAERLSFQALNAASLSDEVDPLYPDRTAVGLNWAVQPGVNVRLTQQFFYGGGEFDDLSITSLDTIVDQQLAENTHMRSRYSLLGGASGLTMQGALGLTHRWAIAPGLAVNLGYERIYGDVFANTAVAQQFRQPFAVGQSVAALGIEEADSYSVGIEYTDNPKFQASARFEHRDSEAGNNTLWMAGAAGRLSPSLTVLGRYEQSNFSNQLITGLLSDTATLRVGLAYRNPKDDRFNSLLRYEYRRNPDTSPESILADSGRGAEDHVFAFEGIYAPSWRWEFYGKYALRHTTSYLADDLSIDNTIHLLQGRVAYRLGYRWDVAGDVRWLGQTDTDFTETGLAVELGYYVTPDLRVGVGYSFGGVDDRDFTGYRSDGGPYLAVNFKVNELLAGFGRQDVAPPQQQESVIEEPVAVEPAASVIPDRTSLQSDSRLGAKQVKWLGSGQE